MRDMFSGRFDQAEALVVPADRQLIKAVALGLSPGSVREADITAGATVVARNTARVTIKGILCTTATRQPFVGPFRTPRRGVCIRNENATSKNFFFTVGLRAGPGPGLCLLP